VPPWGIGEAVGPDLGTTTRSVVGGQAALGIDVEALR
jgi:hypothetical protein